MLGCGVWGGARIEWTALSRGAGSEKRKRRPNLSISNISSALALLGSNHSSQTPLGFWPPFMFVAPDAFDLFRPDFFPFLQWRLRGRGKDLPGGKRAQYRSVLGAT